MSENPENLPPEDADDVLRHWEEALQSHRDPFDALAQVLGGGSDRNRLFRLTGTVLLGCTLEHLLGSGGGGVTYSGRAADGSRVAVKLVMAQTLSSVERFEQECRLLQSLEHPAIVRYRAHTVQEDGTGVLVMDLVQGTDLESLLSQVQDPRRVESAAQRNPAVAALVHKLDLARMRERGESVIGTENYRRRMLRFLATVADGLHHAHERGVVHRDVKPMNVLVDHHLAPVLIDFGLARDLRKLVSLTQSGIAIGTLAYMAPEQIDNDTGAVDRRVDVYSMGLLLYRAMTGHDLRQMPDDVWRSRRRPFLLDAAASRELPLAVQAILYSCLDPRPERRYPDAQRLAADLRAASGDGDVRARIPSWLVRQCRDARNLAAMLTGLLSAIATVLWLQWPRGREVEFVANCDVHAATVVVDDREEVLLGMPVWLPLGSHIARIVGDQVATVERSFVVGDGKGPVRVPLVTHRVSAPVDKDTPKRVPLVVTSGYATSQMAPGLPRDRHFLDGRELPMRGTAGNFVEVEPDLHVIRVVDGKGRVEQQQVVVDGGAVDVQLLPACVAEVDGSFRRTWGSVLSPLPDGLSLRGEAQPWIDNLRQQQPSSSADAVACALVPVVAATEVESVLRVDFPVAMRSMVVHVNHEVRKGGSLSMALHVDGAEPQPFPEVGTGSRSSRMQASAPHGARWVEVRARLSTTRVEQASARLFRGEHMGRHWGSLGVAFAIVADEGGGAVLQPEGRGTSLRDVPVLSSRAVLRFDGRDSAAPAVLRHRDGAIDVLVSEFARSLEASEQVARGRVRRLAWPTLAEKSVLEAECMHPRSKPWDGYFFGSSLQATDDRDGDGWSDFVVADRSSDRAKGGTTHAFARFCSSARDPYWIWPHGRLLAPTPEMLLHWPVDVGDWGGDEEHEFTLHSVGIAVPPGPATTLSMVGGAGAEAIYSLGGAGFALALGCVDALPVRHGPRPILYWEARSAEDGLRQYYVRTGGTGGLVFGPLTATPSCHAMLLPSKQDPEVPDVVVLRLAPAQDDFTGLERYELSGVQFELADRLRLPLPFVVERTRGGAKALPPGAPPPQENGSLVRLDDVDGDGVTDLAVSELAAAESIGVLIVSGANLQPIGRVPLAGAKTALGAFVPATANSPATLLVAARTKAGTELHAIALP